MIKRWLPSPPLSLALFVVWLLLNQSLDAGTLLLAAILAIAVPVLTQGLRPATVRMRRPGLALRLSGVVALDLVPFGADRGLAAAHAARQRHVAVLRAGAARAARSQRAGGAGDDPVPHARARPGAKSRSTARMLLIHVFDCRGRSRLHRHDQVALRAPADGDLRIMTPVLFWALKLALLLLAVAMLCALARLLVGPTAQDRVMALDCLYINGMLMMLVLGIVYASNVYFEAAMLIALFGFVGSTALAKFLLRGEVIE